MKNTKNNLLARISRQAKKLQAGKTGKQMRYPAKFRVLAVRAIAAGACELEVAQSAFVTPWTIRRWQTESVPPIAKKLKVVQDCFNNAETVMFAKVFIGDRVTVQIPLAGLSDKLLDALYRL